MLTEAQIQIQCIKWFRTTYPNILIFAIIPENKRSVRTASIHKQMGLVAGIPDVFCPQLKIWIEIKTPVGTVKPHQEKMHQELQKCGYNTAVARSLEDFKKIIETYAN